MPVKTVRPAIEAARGICGKQKREADREYRYTLHCLAVPCEEGTLLYHTLTGELIQIGPEPMTEAEKEELIARRFLVPTDFDDRKFADEVQQIVGMMRSSERNKTNFTILTTTDCNARCFYCYEIGIPRYPMTEETARETADYILRSSGGKPVKLSWFGGEPLYNRQVIDIICERLREHGAEYESGMVTNGYYLDRETVRHAYEDWHLRKVQITVDGTEKLYNRIKAYIDADENPYRRVMNNIAHALAAGVRVTIRLNMDAGNADDLCRLADDLAERFPDHAKLDVYVALIKKFGGGIHRYESWEETEKKYNAIREKLKAHGLLRVKPLPPVLRQSRCMADHDTSEVILPDGRVGRCEHYSEEMITGHIRDDRRDRAVIEKWKKPLQIPECGQCCLYPICTKLEMCLWQNTCTELDRRIQRNELTEQVIAEYMEDKKRRSAE